MRICPPGSYEYGSYPRSFGQICLQSLLHGEGVAFDVEVVFGTRRLYEFVNLGEGMRGDNVDGLELLGECLVVFCRVAVRETRGGSRITSRNSSEDNDKEYETYRSRCSSAIHRSSIGDRHAGGAEGSESGKRRAQRPRESGLLCCALTVFSSIVGQGNLLGSVFPYGQQNPHKYR